jgi:hypothetical protein
MKVLLSRLRDLLPAGLAPRQTRPIVPFESWRDQAPQGGMQVFRPVVRCLQQQVLPQAFFGGHEALMPSLQAGSSEGGALNDWWYASLRHCVDHGQLPPQVHEDRIAVLDYLRPLVRQTTVQYVFAPGVTGWIIGFPPPLRTTESHFMALCMDMPAVGSGVLAGLHCFTLEASLEFGGAFFCELLPDGSRRNYGHRDGVSCVAFIDQLVEHLVPRGQSSPSQR